MYVDDMTLDEAWEWEGKLNSRIRELAREAPGSAALQQAEWDHEDVCLRLQELDRTEGTQ